ncbi:DEAD/DEAH box helicase [Wenyingzhuangia sp. 2_MG-2023]|uniref:DEAD/DEAH box helicase n=1 Tax=Wenyingzhuangia sp. 2_MG-2023 TaxID=3062639 RepID=UPI0026E1DCC4|nr:DEAD/DEAH box helicase family protein [Wenyingzhuangia sp. 2_MG-2023]MDO6739360.1 DEAD/DEAH box helicase family protein [Wenyingzhuangia sp. 2_MG-2023]
MRVILPSHFNLKEKIGKDFVYQLGFDKKKIDGTLQEYTYNRVNGYLLTENGGREILVASRKNWSANDRFDYVLQAKDFDNINEGDFSNYIWIRHPDFAEPNTFNEVKESFNGAFSFKQENLEEGIEGLRSPQIGGIYATLAHWQIGSEPATIVMPTGTGKTETMISLLITANCDRILIVVPSEALRSQLAKKFITLGLLKHLGIVNEDILYPRVGILKHRPKTEQEVNDFFENCNVIITTMSVVGQITPQIQTRISDYCSHLFIDEAHHIAAKTWRKFIETFKEKHILQFTATPFRNDDKSIGGKIIFNYPLNKAQEEGYFKKIDYYPIYEFNSFDYDRSIAEKAVEILRADLANDYNHILMARVNSTSRANEVYEIYKEYEDLNPIQAHTGLKNEEQKEAIRKILNYETRIIICVDMFGEGFDMPELKIAAFHDVKKSLPITLQLAGRFTRTNRDNNLGNASIVVNLANVEVTEELQSLYSQDSDWNQILPVISDENSREQESLFEFMQGFDKFPNEIQLQNIRPALSTVVYKTNTETWQPNNFEKGIIGIDNFDQVYSDINIEKRTLVIVTGNRVPVKWGDLKDIFRLEWTLYVVYWNQDQQLLYINCSANGSMFEKLAEAVSLGTATPINAEDVYRSLGKITRLKINNVGLKEQLGKQKSFTMHTGEDIEPALSTVQLLNKIKSNIFGVGFEDGEKISIGCSYKGRVWTRKNGNIEELINWCNYTGDKLLDETIDPNMILSGAIYPHKVDSRPELMPIMVEWNDEVYKKNEQAVYIVHNDFSYPLDSFELELLNPLEKGDINIVLYNERFRSVYRLEINADNFAFINVENPCFIQFGATAHLLSEYFYSYSPIIRFLNGAWLEGNQFVDFVFDGSSFERNKIIAWDWTGVNIREESQGEQKATGNIQHKVITVLQNKDFDIIFDDDSSGEAADLITVKVDDIAKKIIVELYHLKYSHGENAGARISDLYEVCGQAQKSVFWKGKGGFALFKHLIKRESRRVSNGKNSRFEKGTIENLALIKEKSKRFYKTDFKIYIVQPGLSIERASEQQLELLAVTENHLLETYKIDLEVIASE